MKTYNSKPSIKMTASVFSAGAILSVWAGIIIAPHTGNGIFKDFDAISAAFSQPFKLTICSGTPKAVLIFLMIWSFAFLCYLDSIKNYRRGEEYGSAKWGDPIKLNKELADEEYCKNRLLSQNLRLSMDGWKTHRNNNILIVGGAGAGKSRGYAQPNLLQADGCSFIVLDPKGENLLKTGSCLKNHGYDVKVFNLINMDSSLCYNPFVYFEDDNSVQILVTDIFKATSGKSYGNQGENQYWENQAEALLSAVFFYLYYETPIEDQTIANAVMMIRKMDNDKDKQGAAMNPIDALFAALAMKEPEHIAVKYYEMYHAGTDRELSSIRSTCLSHLTKFNLGSLEKLTSCDEIDIPSIGQKKTALFLVVPDDDTTFNFLVSLLYMQLFQQLKKEADNNVTGMLDIPVHIIMDEFNNVVLPPDFEHIISVIRSRLISVTIILQGLSQLKNKYEKEWESIKGNCDTYIYMGGNESSTQESISKSLGKETEDINTYGKSHGGRGSFNTNYQKTGRELLDPAEIAQLDNSYEIIQIRGKLPVCDLKYDVTTHPNYKEMYDGEVKPGQKNAAHGEPYLIEKPIETEREIPHIEQLDPDSEYPAGVPVETIDGDKLLEEYKKHTAACFTSDEIMAAMETKENQIRTENTNKKKYTTVFY